MSTSAIELSERLVHAGTGSDAEIAALAAEVGAEALVDALATEILFRCPDPINSVPVNVALDISFEDVAQRLVFRLAKDQPVRLVDDPDPMVHTRLGMSLTDLVRRLYGRSTGPRRDCDFTKSFLPVPPGDQDELHHLLTAAPQATETLLTACSTRPFNLNTLSARYGSDKWANFHWYTPHYERHFAPYRDEPVRVLEIGIGGWGDDPGGVSLQMWKRYFHRGLIYGLDIQDRTVLTAPRLTALVADQSDRDALTAIAREHGPFDIVIDDGSHVNEHVRISFHTLFPHLRQGGLYVIEDLQTSYLASYGGSSGGVAQPDTSIGLIKRLLDDMHHQEHGEGPEEPTLTQRTVVGVHAYHNIVFVEKGINGEERLSPARKAAWEAAFRQL